MGLDKVTPLCEGQLRCKQGRKLVKKKSYKSFTVVVTRNSTFSNAQIWLMIFMVASVG